MILQSAIERSKGVRPAGWQAATRPAGTVVLGADAEAVGMGVRDGSPQLMIALATVERSLDVAPQYRGIDVVEQV